MSKESTSRRGFLTYATVTMGAIGIGGVGFTLSKSMGPKRDYSFERETLTVDLGEIPSGQQITISFQGKPLSIRHRTSSEIGLARQQKVANLIDQFANNMNLNEMEKAVDQNRSIGPNGEYVVVSGNCTRLGCGLGRFSQSYSYWICPCCGARYDSAGRVIKGPAINNLPIPRYSLSSENKLVLMPKSIGLSDDLFERLVYG